MLNAFIYIIHLFIFSIYIYIYVIIWLYRNIFTTHRGVTKLGEHFTLLVQNELLRYPYDQKVNNSILRLSILLCSFLWRAFHCFDARSSFAALVSKQTVRTYFSLVMFILACSKSLQRYHLFIINRLNPQLTTLNISKHVRGVCRLYFFSTKRIKCIWCR